MKRVVVFVVVLLVVMEGISWWAYRTFFQKNPVEGSQEISTNPNMRGQDQRSDAPEQATAVPEAVSGANSQETAPVLELGSYDPENFPPPSVEMVNGRVERTIHMGVRRYVWEPATLRAKKGELVRLIVHNADDVKHGLVIPDLGVMNEDIPAEGAVIEFTPQKTGTFEFFCSYYCGEGHMEMRGRMIIEE